MNHTLHTYTNSHSSTHSPTNHVLLHQAFNAQEASVLASDDREGLHDGDLVERAVDMREERDAGIVLHVRRAANSCSRLVATAGSEVHGIQFDADPLADDGLVEVVADLQQHGRDLRAVDELIHMKGWWVICPAIGSLLLKILLVTHVVAVHGLVVAECASSQVAAPGCHAVSVSY